MERDAAGRHQEVEGWLIHWAAVANIKSQIKRNRQNEAARTRNKAVRTALKTATRKVRIEAESGEPDEAGALYRDAARDLDRAASKGVIHKRAAARKKSRLARRVAAASAASAE